MTDTTTLEIDPPITHQGGTYATLELREPKAGEVRKADGQLRNGVTQESLRNREIHLVALVTGAPVPVIEQLPISKLNEAMSFLAPLLERGRAIGES